jgi:hypothetical protein
MTCTEYSKMLQISTLNFEGNNLTDSCRDFLQGILEKNFTKRFSFDRTMNHPWLVIIRKKIDDICEKYHHDSEKMISILKNTKVTNEDFNSQDYREIIVSREEALEPEESLSNSKNLMNKKRRRQMV